MPTAKTPRTIDFLNENFLGLTDTKVFFLLIKRSTKKYPQAKQFEIKVAQPAPAAPMSSPHGITSIGSSTILSRQPLIVPTLAWSEAPSALTR